MSDLEDQLRRLPLSAPSAELDRRMEAAFAREEVAQASRLPLSSSGRRDACAPSNTRRLLRGIGALGGLAAAVALLFFPHLPVPWSAPPPVALVYCHCNSSQTRLVRLFLEPAAAERPLPNLVVNLTSP